MRSHVQGCRSNRRARAREERLDAGHAITRHTARPRCPRPVRPGHKGGLGNPFARRSTAIRSAFLNAISIKDLQAIVRTLVEKAKADDLVAAKLILLWAISRPDNPVHLDGVAARLAAEARADDLPPPIPADREACLDLAARALAEEIRALRDLPPAPGGVGELALEDRD